MTKEYRITGGKSLKGRINVHGSKNAALPIIIASTLIRNKTTLHNIPNITDIQELLEILKKLNVSVKYKKNKLKIDSSKIKYAPLIMEEIEKFRASYYFIGAFLYLFNKVEIIKPGGCKIGARPIDQHISGLKQLGAKIEIIDNHINAEIKNINEGIITLSIPSVGATINIILASLNTKGKIVINNSAKEPEVVDFICFLNKVGFSINGAGTNQITILPKRTIKKVKYRIIPDRIVAGTFLLYGALLAKKLKINNFIISHNTSLISILKSVGVKIKERKKTLIVYKSKIDKSINVQTGVYPNFPTDLQQVLTAFLLYNQKKSKVTETIFEDRFSFLNEIKKSGGNFALDKDTVEIIPSKTISTTFSCQDLRGGAALLLVCLNSKGVSTLKDVQYIERGYENIVKKLKKIGAEIYEAIKE